MFDRFTREHKILSTLKPWGDGGCGPVLYEEDGRYYTDDPECPHHFCVTGRTRMGKSKSVTIPTVYSVIHSKNSAIIVDSSKGEIFRATAPYAKQQGSHRLWHIDLSQPWSSPDSYNPLWELHWKMHHENPQINDDALADAMQFQRLIPRQRDDQFWEEAGGQFLAGLILALLEIADEEEINFMSLQSMVAESLVRVANSTMIRELVGFMPDESPAKPLLHMVADTAKETAGSLFAITASAINKLCTSEGLLDMTSGHSLTCQDLDVDEPLLIYITLPSDQTTAMAGLMVNQLVTHFIRLADRSNTGKLNHELWCILEEIGVTGPYLRELPEWMSTTLGRNIRFLVISQSAAQLDRVFGPDGAREIRDNAVSIHLANGDPVSLRTISDLCGKYTVFSSQGEREYPRMTPDQIAGLGAGQCLVQSQGLLYVTRLPIYTRLFTPIEAVGEVLPFHDRDYYKKFSLERFVMDLRKEHLDELLSQSAEERKEKPGFEVAHSVFRKQVETKRMTLAEAVDYFKHRADNMKKETLSEQEDKA